jgi:hypothetical protein
LTETHSTIKLNLKAFVLNHLNSEKNIEKTNTEVAEMQEELKQQEAIRKNKDEYNEIATQVRQFEPQTEMERYPYN